MRIDVPVVREMSSYGLQIDIVAVGACALLLLLACDGPYLLSRLYLSCGLPAQIEGSHPSSEEIPISGTLVFQGILQHSGSR